MHFAKLFTLKYCSYGKRYHSLARKIWIWEALLTVMFLRLCNPFADYSFCVDITAPMFLKIIPPLKMKFSQVSVMAYTYITKGFKQTVGSKGHFCQENVNWCWNFWKGTTGKAHGTTAIDRSSRLRPRRTCEQEHVGLSNAFLHNSAARAKIRARMSDLICRTFVALWLVNTQWGGA